MAEDKTMPELKLDPGCQSVALSYLSAGLSDYFRL